MGTATESELAVLLQQVQAQLAEVTARLAKLEGAASAPSVAAEKLATVAVAPAEAAPTASAEPVRAEITEAEVLAVAAALAAYLGVRVHIRQIRLVSSHAWAQEGRVSIQASHRLHS